MQNFPTLALTEAALEEKTTQRGDEGRVKEIST
jgi:hypothetical protein